MVARTIRVIPGVVASVMLFAAPAYADNVPDSKHRVASSHRRSTAGLRHVRADRYLHARQGGELAFPSAPDDSAAFTDARDTSNAKDDPLDRHTIESGIASWYGPRHQGHITSSGRRFDQNELTAAHRWLPLGTRVRVRLVESDRFVDVTITDRPGNRRRIIDLSREAARQLGFLDRGLARVTLSHF